MKDLAGRVVLVTGGGSGIGRASALSFAGAGSRVVVADVDGVRAEAVADEVAAIGAEALGVRCDVTSDRDIEELRDRALERFGRVDVVMNNAGVIAAGEPADIPISEWQRVLDVNVVSIARSIRTFLPMLVERGEGHIVNTASVGGLFSSSPDRLPYTASKGAVIALSEALSLYARPRGVGVTCLCPGPVLTNIRQGTRFHGTVGTVPDIGLTPLEPAAVGDMVVGAVQENRFLLLTHPVETTEILARRARDYEAFLETQIDALR